RGRPGTGQPVDVDRTAHAEVLDLGMVRVPRLDLEPVDEPAPESTDDRGVGRRAQVTVVLEAVEQHVEALAEVTGPEVGEPGLGGRPREQLGARRVAARAHARPSGSPWILPPLGTVIPPSVDGEATRSVQTRRAC